MNRTDHIKQNSSQKYFSRYVSRDVFSCTSVVHMIFSFLRGSFGFPICVVFVILLLDFVMNPTLLILLNHLYFQIETIFINEKLHFRESIQYMCFFSMEKRFLPSFLILVISIQRQINFSLQASRHIFLNSSYAIS